MFHRLRQGSGEEPDKEVKKNLAKERGINFNRGVSLEQAPRLSAEGTRKIR